ncbi:MAG TPA: lysophospholipid acyltransferase family protein [Chloroflexota bacterium]|nr:lysophospholipid acyltransferase family protein [Chloroflexota bacterium]
MLASNVSPAGNRWRYRLRRHLTLLAWHGAQRLDAMLPRRARFILATGLGELLYWLLHQKRANVLDNMARVLGPQAPPETVRLVAKRSFRNFAKYLSEFVHLPRWSAPDLEHLIDSVSGWHHVADALKDGKGVIFVSPHFGNWDVAGWYFGRRHAFSAVAEPLQPPELDALVQGWREAKRINIIPLAQAARRIWRTLRDGGIVALVVDRPTHAKGDGVPVRFFGEWTRVPAGAAHFALRTGAPVIAAGVWRTPQNAYAAFALPPLRFTPTGDQESDVRRVMQRIMEDIEHIIRAHPDQWYMFRRMWPSASRDGQAEAAERSPIGGAPARGTSPLPLGRAAGQTGFGQVSGVP